MVLLAFPSSNSRIWRTNKFIGVERSASPPPLESFQKLLFFVPMGFDVTPYKGLDFVLQPFPYDSMRRDFRRGSLGLEEFNHVRNKPLVAQEFRWELPETRSSVDARTKTELKIDKRVIRGMKYDDLGMIRNVGQLI